jgi:hypothetical protein
MPQVWIRRHEYRSEIYVTLTFFPFFLTQVAYIFVVLSSLTEVFPMAGAPHII